MSWPHLGALLSGPFVQILHDEKGGGSFVPLLQNRSLPMLAYFSSTMRQQFHNDAHGCHQQWPQPYPPTAVRLVGGQGRSIIDIVEWMVECCRSNAILPLRSIVKCPVRHILSMDAVEKLGIEHLSHELPQMTSRLRYELFDVRTVGRIFSTGTPVLPQIMDAICLCVARYFFHGSLPEVDRWMSLSRLNARFDQGVKNWLAPGALQEGPDVLGAANLWERKVPSSYPAAWHRPIWDDPPLQLPYPATPNDWSHSCTHQPSGVTLPVPGHPAPPNAFPGEYSHGPAMPFAPPPPQTATGQPPPLPPKPEAYHPSYISSQPFHRRLEAPEPYRPYRPRHDPRYHRPPSPVPDYTVRCSYCQEIYPQSTAAAHQCATGRAFTVSDSPSPPTSYSHPRRRSRSAHRGRSVSQHDAFRGRSLSRHDLLNTGRSGSQHDRHFRGRSSSQHDHFRCRRAFAPYPWWDPAYEPPRPGEYLRERQQIGPNDFLHFFVDEYGRERIVNKSGDMALEERPW